MKTKLLVFLFGLLFAVGCSTTPAARDDIHARVVKADNDWIEYAKVQQPKMWDMGIVNRERKMYERVSKSDVPEWRKRRAAWNYIIAVNEARIPDVPQPPGRGSTQPNPFY